MNTEVLMERFTNQSGSCFTGSRVTTLLVPELGPLPSDPLAALEQQHQHQLAIQRSRRECIEFVRLPDTSRIAPGCILESQLLGDCLRVISYSKAEMVADVEPV